MNTSPLKDNSATDQLSDNEDSNEDDSATPVDPLENSNNNNEPPTDDSMEDAESVGSNDGSTNKIRTKTLPKIIEESVRFLQDSGEELRFDLALPSCLSHCVTWCGGCISCCLLQRQSCQTEL